MLEHVARYRSRTPCVRDGEVRPIIQEGYIGALARKGRIVPLRNGRYNHPRHWVAEVERRDDHVFRDPGRRRKL